MNTCVIVLWEGQHYHAVLPAQHLCRDMQNGFVDVKEHENK